MAQGRARGSVTLTGAVGAAILLLAALIGHGPAAAETITVYTAYEVDEAAAFLEVAKADLPDIDIRLVRLSTGELTARILSEMSAPQHDVIWGQAVTTLVDPRILSTLEPYSPDSIDKLPDRFRDPGGRWFAVTGYMAAFCVNTERLAARNLPMPTSWADLARPEYKGEIVMPNPTTSGTGYIQVISILQQKGEAAGWDQLKALDANVAHYSESGSRPCEEAATGRYAIGASFALRALKTIADGRPVRMVIPREGAGNELEGNALATTSQHKPSAKRFLDWTMSERAVIEYYQWKEIVTARGSYMPVRFKRAGLPADVSTVMFTMNFEAAARDRSAVLARWRREFGTRPPARP